MFSDILKIIPKLDEKDLKKMQNNLQSRFTKIAKGFGKGLASAITGGGIVALGAMIINKLLNPLKETQEAIDKILKDSDDVVTNAQQFETTTGNLVKLRALGTATGLEPDQLYMLLTKYQTAVAEARQDPTKQTSVRKFVDEKDTVAGFFSFIQAMQKLTKEQQVLVQKEVFGEKQILKMADFLSSDFPKLIKQVGGPSTAVLGQSANKAGQLNDYADILKARREQEDLVNKADRLNLPMIFRGDQAERMRLQRENERISNYNMLAKVQDTMDRVTATLEMKIYKEMRDWTKIFEGVSKIIQLQGKLNDLKKSRSEKGE